MAKTYLEIVKYMVESKFTISGVVDKPDIIGAVFGQTEGLLGNDLDLRELQKNGKIGRIEIDVQQTQNKTFGKLHLPASLDRIETCILAAAIESVDRVGPYEANFAVEKVEDTRSEKRRKILARAKELVKILLNTEIPDSREISEMVQSDVRASEVTTYGPEALSAGPDIDKSQEIIIVEGRADVLNLLRNDITNAIAIGGATANVPKTIIRLANEKESTLFLDGDRGGDLIFRSVINAGAEVDFVTKAPDGKEVEDLTRKEVIKSIRSRIPADQYSGIKINRKPDNMQQMGPSQSAPQQTTQQQFRKPMPSPMPSPMPQHEPESIMPAANGNGNGSGNGNGRGISPIGEDTIQQIETTDVYSTVRSKATSPVLESMVLTQLGTGLDELSGTLRSRLYDNTGSVMKETPIRELLVAVQESQGPYAIVLDGVITQRLIELALQKEIKAIYGIRANPLTKKYHGIILYTKEQGKIE